MQTHRYMRIVILIFILSFATVVTAQDKEQPKLSTTFLENDVPLNGTFIDDLTAQLYSFYGSAGDVVTISMVQEEGSDLDPYVVLLGPRGEVLASDDDSGELTFSSLISDVELPSDGTYFVLATSFIYIDDILEEASESLIEGQNYELTVSGINTPTGEDVTDETFQYYSGNLETGSNITAETTDAEPVYYYTFLGKEGDVVDITLESDDFDTILHLFGQDGVRLAVNDDSGDGSLNSAITEFTLPADGLYLVFATNVFFYDFDQQEVGEFTITLN